MMIMSKEQLEAITYTHNEVKRIGDTYRGLMVDMESRLKVKTALIEELKNKIQSRDETISHLKDLIKND